MRSTWEGRPIAGKRTAAAPVSNPSLRPRGAHPGVQSKDGSYQVLVDDGTVIDMAAESSGTWRSTVLTLFWITVTLAGLSVTVYLTSNSSNITGLEIFTDVAAVGTMLSGIAATAVFVIGYLDRRKKPEQDAKNTEIRTKILTEAMSRTENMGADELLALAELARALDGAEESKEKFAGKDDRLRISAGGDRSLESARLSSNPLENYLATVVDIALKAQEAANLRVKSKWASSHAHKELVRQMQERENDRAVVFERLQRIASQPIIEAASRLNASILELERVTSRRPDSSDMNWQVAISHFLETLDEVRAAADRERKNREYELKKRENPRLD